MYYLAFGFFLGVCTLNCCKVLPDLFWLTILFLPFLYLIDFKRNIFYIFRYTRTIWVLCSAFCCGFSWALVYANNILTWNLPTELEGKNLQITGYISSLPQINSRQTSFTFDTLTCNQQKQKTKLQISWFGAHPPLTVGEEWQFVVRLKRPHGTLNPGGFDYEKYLFEHHIRATGYVVPYEQNKLLASHWYKFPLARLRQKLQKQMMQLLLNSPLTGIITNLVIGDESQITPAQWQVFRATGTSYLMAISGLHIGLVGAILYYWIDLLWRRGKYLPLILPAKCAAALAAFCSALLYSVVSGFSIPTQRAMLMLTVFLGMVFFRRNILTWDSFFIALFVVLVLDPIAVLSMGFWLSFAAVAVIIFATANRTHAKDSKELKFPWLSKFWGIFNKYCHMQFVVTLGLLPLTLLFFHQVSYLVLIANLIAMPGVCLLVVPLALMGALISLFHGYFGGWIIWIAAKLMQLIWLWLSWMAQFTTFTWQHAVFNWWIFAAACLGIILLLLPRGFPGKILGTLWLLPIILWIPTGPQQGEVWFTLLDVGQGLASVVQTAQHTLIYDTGLKLLTGDSGANIVVPFLINAGINDISTLVVSHGDADHAGGVASIVAAFPVQNIYSSVPLYIAPGKAQHCYAGQSWNWDGITFKFLAPEVRSTFVGNNASCVLKITINNNSILLTGDIEKDAEKELNSKQNIHAAVLVAPHHGSATSSTKNFIAAVDPEYVLFPVGYRNRFRFPAKSVVARYQTFVQYLLSTANTGAITFKISPNSAILAPQLYRNAYQHYWNAATKI